MTRTPYLGRERKGKDTPRPVGGREGMVTTFGKRKEPPRLRPVREADGPARGAPCRQHPRGTAAGSRRALGGRTWSGINKRGPSGTAGGRPLSGALPRAKDV